MFELIVVFTILTSTPHDHDSMLVHGNVQYATLEECKSASQDVINQYGTATSSDKAIGIAFACLPVPKK